SIRRSVNRATIASSAWIGVLRGVSSSQTLFPDSRRRQRRVFHVERFRLESIAMNAARASSSREWLVISALTVAGAILRAWAFPRLSLSHFDEGVYAFAGLWSLSRHGLLDLDPGVIAYAPPGFPILVGLSYLVFGVSDYAAIAVSVVAGIVTIPVVGWLGQRTFGPGAGAAAAAFAALAIVHVA